MHRYSTRIKNWLALAPALLVIGLLVSVSLLYALAQSLGMLARAGLLTMD